MKHMKQKTNKKWDCDLTHVVNRNVKEHEMGCQESKGETKERNPSARQAAEELNSASLVV